MQKFKFRLEQVLQQKISLEEQALMEQSKAQLECSRCEKELADTEEKLEEMYQRGACSLKPDELMHQLMFREQLQLLKEKQTRNLQRANEILQLRRDAAIHARQERMVLEKLKEKKLLEYQELQLLVEQKEIDELATVSFVRTKD